MPNLGPEVVDEVSPGRVALDVVTETSVADDRQPEVGDGLRHEIGGAEQQVEPLLGVQAADEDAPVRLALRNSRVDQAGVDRVLDDGDAFGREAVRLDATGASLGVREPPVRQPRVARLRRLGHAVRPRAVRLEVGAVSPEGDLGAARRLAGEQRVVGRHAAGLLDDDQVRVPRQLDDGLPHNGQATGAQHLVVDDPRPRQLGLVTTSRHRTVAATVDEGEVDPVGGQP